MKMQDAFRGLCLVICCWTMPVAAQSFPSKPITFVVPYPPGGTADLLPRLVAEKLPDILGVPVVVMNKPGAAGIVGAELVSRAAPDGYTLLVVPPHFFVSDLLYKVSFDPKKFVPVSIIASYPNVLLVSPTIPVNDVPQLLAWAKSQNRSLNFASAGTGSSQHLTTEMLKDMTKLDFQHVPYKGTAPAIADLIAGHVDIMFDNLITALPYVQSGRLKLLGVASPARNRLFPKTPTMAETLPGFESVTWMGLTAPPGTPTDVVQKLSHAIGQVLADPKIHKQIADLQAEPLGNSSAQMAETVRLDTVRWTQVIRSANITAQ